MYIPLFLSLSSLYLSKILFAMSHIQTIFRNISKTIDLKLLLQFVVGSFSWLNSGMKLVLQLELQLNTEMHS